MNLLESAFLLLMHTLFPMLRLAPGDSFPRPLSREKEQEALGGDLLAFLQAVNPEEAEKVNHIYQYSESWMDNQRYVYFTLWQDERGHDNFSDHVGDIIVQVSPVVRIVHYTVEGFSATGGNG